MFGTFVLIFEVILLAIAVVFFFIGIYGIFFFDDRMVAVQAFKIVVIVLVGAGVIYVKGLMPNPQEDMFNSVTEIAIKHYPLCYEDGYKYSGEATADGLVKYADGNYTMYLRTKYSKKMWVRSEDEMLETKYKNDVEPMVEKVLIIKFYKDSVLGYMKISIPEIKYQLTLPSEEYLSK